MKSSVSSLSFTDHALGVVLKKSSLCPNSSRFSWMLSSRRFIIRHFTSKSMIHFESIFVKMSIFFCMLMYSYSSIIWWKDYLCSIALPFLLCQRSVFYIHRGSISELPALFHWSICLFFQQYHTVFLLLLLVSGIQNQWTNKREIDSEI